MRSVGANRDRVSKDVVGLAIEGQLRLEETVGVMRKSMGDAGEEGDVIVNGCDHVGARRVFGDGNEKRVEGVGLHRHQ
jgi:hypothetical protein